MPAAARYPAVKPSWYFAEEKLFLEALEGVAADTGVIMKGVLLVADAGGFRGGVKFIPVNALVTFSTGSFVCSSATGPCETSETEKSSSFLLNDARQQHEEVRRGIEIIEKLLLGLTHCWWSERIWLDFVVVQKFFVAPVRQLFDLEESFLEKTSFVSAFFGWFTVEILSLVAKGKEVDVFQWATESFNVIKETFLLFFG